MPNPRANTPFRNPVTTRAARSDPTPPTTTASETTVTQNENQGTISNENSVNTTLNETFTSEELRSCAKCNYSYSILRAEPGEPMC